MMPLRLHLDVSDDEQDEAMIGTFDFNDGGKEGSAHNKLCSTNRISAVLATKCCGFLCATELSFKAAYRLVQEWHVLSHKNRRNYLHTAVTHGEKRQHATKPVYLLRFVVDQKPYYMCSKAVAYLFSATTKTIYTALKRARLNVLPVDIAIPRAVQVQSPQHVNMVAWLHDYIRKEGQFNPTNNMIVMPVRLTHQQLYAEYKAAVSDEEQHKILSVSSMIRILHLKWPNLQFPRLNGLGRCDRCFQLKQEIGKNISDAEKRMIKEELNAHLTVAREEREAYAERIRESKNLSNRILSIAFDGASSIQFPHEWPAPRMITNGSRLEVLLYGSLTHTFHRRRLYTSPPAYTHDVNYVLTVLSYEIVKSLQSHVHFDPTTLYLQADNCASQNKNQFLFAFIAILLFNGWFIDVHFNFLSVGHTHDDVDAIFGLFAAQRRKTCTSAPTLPNLIDGVTTGAKPAFKADQFVAIGGLWNWKAYINANKLLSLHDFLGARSFHFRRTADGVRLRYRQTSATSEPWIGVNFDKDSVLVAEVPPSGELTPVQPTAEQLEHMRSRAADVRSRLPQTYTVAQHEWFNSFTRNPCPMLTAPPEECLELLRMRQHPEPQFVPPPALHAPLPKIASPLDVKLSYHVHFHRLVTPNEIIAVQPAADQMTEDTALASAPVRARNKKTKSALTGATRTHSVWTWRISRRRPCRHGLCCGRHASASGPRNLAVVDKMLLTKGYAPM